MDDHQIIDFTTGLPYEGIDDRLVEAVYLKDPGFFFLSHPGSVYHLWHVLVTTRLKRSTIHVPIGLAFEISCPSSKKAITHHYIYSRWFFGVFRHRTPEMHEFSCTFCTELPDGRYRFKRGLLNGLIEARMTILNGLDRCTAEYALLNHDWYSDDVPLLPPAPAARSTAVDNMWDELKSSSDRKNRESVHESSVIVG